MKAEEVLNLLQISRRALHVYSHNDRIRYTVMPNRRYDYNEEDVYKILNKDIRRKTVLYARVSTAKQKNDKVDLLKLSKLHLVGMIPESHLLEEDQRIFRDLLIQKIKLGRLTSTVKNSITGYLKREDLFSRLPDTNDNFSIKRRNAMREITFGNQKDLVLKTMLDRLEFLEKQMIPLEAEIKNTAKDSEDLTLLRSIQGIDYYLASLISSYIGNINRFESSDRLASFFGIITSTKDSSSIKRRGHMSKVHELQDGHCLLQLIRS